MSQAKRSVTTTREALIRLASVVIFVAGIFQFFVGIKFISLVNSTDTAVMTYVLVFIGGVAIIILSILEFAYEWIDFKLNPSIYTIICLVELILWYFMLPASTDDGLSISIGNSIGMFGVFFLFVALRPNFGPTANKKIYQAVAGIMSFVISVLFIGLGIYVATILDIADFAGNGTYPSNFYDFFIAVIPDNSGIFHYNGIITSGTWMIATGVFVMVVSILRNKINLKIASIGLLAGIIWGVADVITFGTHWEQLDRLFFNTPELAPQYYTTLQLSDPGVVTIGVVLILLFGISLIMMIYASFASKPIATWRRKRDSSIAAAEVFFREGQLPKAIKYLEQAAQLSSKIDEEDKAVELLTRIKQIKDKAIKMKKAEAAQKAKKEYEKQQKAEKKAKKKSSKAKSKKTTKDSASDEMIKAKMKDAMDKKDK